MQERAERGEHERHVLPRHGEQVAQAHGVERVAQDGGLGPVVAEHEPGQQRPVIGVERAGAALEAAVDLVGQAVGHRAGPHVVHGLDVDGADEPPPRSPLDLRGRQRRAPAAQLHHLAGQGSGQATGRGAARPQLHPLSLEPGDGTCARHHPLRIGDEHGSALHRSGHRGVEAGEGAVAQRRGEQ